MHKREDGMSKKLKLSALLAGAAIAPWLLTVTGLPSAAQPLESAAKDEVFGVTSVINLPDSQKLGAFDIGFVDPAHAVYLLADRTNASIDVVDTSTNQLINQFKPGFVGATGNNDTSGPDGVLVANGTQLRPFSQSVMEACLKASNEVNAETSATNPAYKKVLESMEAFKNDEYLWWQVAEYAFDSFMIRARARG